MPRSRARPCAFCAFSGRGAACALCIPADVPPIPGTRSGCRPERPGFEPSQHPGQVRPTVTCELSVLICEIHVTTGPFFFFLQDDSGLNDNAIKLQAQGEACGDLSKWGDTGPFTCLGIDSLTVGPAGATRPKRDGTYWSTLIFVLALLF